MAGQTVFSTDVFFEGDFGTHTIQSDYNPHYHSFIEITYVMEGEARHITTHGEEKLTKSDFYILRPKDMHTYVDFGHNGIYHRDIICSLKLFEEICASVLPGIYEKIMEDADYIKLPFPNENFYMAEELIKKYSSLPFEQTQLRYAYIKLIISQFLAVYMNTRLHPTDNENDLYFKILTTLRTPGVLQGGIDKLVSTLNFSHGYICRIIRQHTDKTLIALLTEARMQYACQLLKSPNLSIVDVAYSVGYESFSHFIQLFKKQVGITPLQYQKKQREMGTPPQEILLNSKHKKTSRRTARVCTSVFGFPPLAALCGFPRCAVRFRGSVVRFSALLPRRGCFK